jgi:hypothetical protein
MRARILVALTFLVGLAIAACWKTSSAPERSKARMADWDVPDLVAYLHGRGLPLHLSPTGPGANTRINAYLSTTAKPGAELYWLAKDTRRMQAWAGVVYCELSRSYEDREGVVEEWAECGLRVGPFVFFGDPKLLARIRTALGHENDSGTPAGGVSGRGTSRRGYLGHRSRAL